MRTITLRSSIGHISIIIHYLDGEVAEVYAVSPDGVELAFGYDVAEVIDKLFNMGL